MTNPATMVEDIRELLCRIEYPVSSTALVRNEDKICDAFITLIAERDQAVKELAESQRQLINAQDNNHKRNLELDALHYVWCDGGCKSGIHRYGEHPPLTAELVAIAERNTARLRRWFVNEAGRHDSGTTREALRPVASHNH